MLYLSIVASDERYISLDSHVTGLTHFEGVKNSNIFATRGQWFPFETGKPWTLKFPSTKL